MLHDMIIKRPQFLRETLAHLACTEPRLSGGPETMSRPRRSKLAHNVHRFWLGHFDWDQVQPWMLESCFFLMLAGSAVTLENKVHKSIMLSSAVAEYYALNMKHLKNVANWRIFEASESNWKIFLRQVPIFQDWLMLLSLLHKKQSSSFAGSSICSNLFYIWDIGVLRSHLLLCYFERKIFVKEERQLVQNSSRLLAYIYSCVLCTHIRIHIRRV